MTELGNCICEHGYASTCPVHTPAEPPHVACSCPMCCPAKHEINAALANPAGYTVAGETKWSTILGKKDDAVVVASATADWKPPAPAVAAPAEGKVPLYYCEACDTTNCGCLDVIAEAEKAELAPTPPPAAAAGELLCKVTGNTCGSDTWPKGLVCPCEPCQSWLESQPAQAKPTRTVTHQMARNAFRKMHDALHNSLIHPAIVRFARRRYPSLSIPARLDDADIVLSDYICQQRDLATPPAEDFENNLAQSFEDNRKIIGKLRATREPADLEGKLRSLELYYAQKNGCRNGHHSAAGKICVDCVADELDRQRALGRVEGLAMAEKLQQGFDKWRDAEDDVNTWLALNPKT